MWIIDLFNISVGVFVGLMFGWNFLERPEWAKKLWDKWFSWVKSGWDWLLAKVQFWK